MNKPIDTVAIHGKSIKFETMIEAIPKAKVSWYLNDKEISLKDGVKFENNPKTSACNLVIPKILVSHLGKYTIKASNIVGEAEHTFELNVLGNIVCLFDISIFFNP